MILQTADIITQKTTNYSLTNKGKIMKKNILPIIMALVLAVMLMVPLTNPVLYILFGIDIAATVVLAIVCFTEKIREKYYQMIPRFVLFWTVFYMGIVISITRNILTTEALENQNKISTMIFGVNTSNKNLIISSLIFVCLTAVGILISAKGKKQLKEKWENVKNEGNKDKMEFFGNLDGSYKFLNGAFTFNLIITAVIFFGCALTGSLNFGKPMIDCIRESLLLAMGTSIIFQALSNFCIFIVSNCFKKPAENS